MRKKVDSRIRTLVENCVKLRHRCLFVLVGDKGRDQVVSLHYMLSKTVVKARPNVLWCYKKDLYLSSHRKKRMRQIQKMQQRGLLDPEKEDPFALFVASTDIRYCYYNETHKILGNTYGMCVLQDFEALTPNLLARTIETVQGGGIIVMLLSNLNSLSQLYTLTMDVHARFRTESHQEVIGRFNERLVLSLAGNMHCMLLDDELNILPTSSLVQHIRPLPLKADGTPDVPDPSRQSREELQQLQGSLVDTQPAGALLAKCVTLDQGKALVTFLDAASEKTLRSTVALTAARGRGKSAALGLSIAGALALGYSNIFVTAPSPENLRTLFEFVFKGLDALGYQEHLEYDLVESTNPTFGKAIVRVNVYKEHRQTVQYIQPQHHSALSQAELLVIDEAAAIPLPIVKSLLGPYLVFLCSTVNGYEGTGRSLSLKLLQQLREQGARLSSKENSALKEGQAASRVFREVQLQEPIRYALGDPIEQWLHQLLCLDAAEHVPPAPPRLPHPDECQLYYVHRDTLFSFHKASELFLQRCMSLYVSSHYKNTPNDLLLLADAPAHHLFVLLGPHDETKNALPDILAVMQVSLEGAISKKAAHHSLSAGKLPQGDLIPWIVGQQFQDSEFPGLSGARIVRIAVHPEMTGGGYGRRSIELLRKYYQGELQDVLSEAEEDELDMYSIGRAERRAAKQKQLTNGTAKLLEEQLAPRQRLPPLLISLGERPPEPLHYLGVSFGITQQLLNFWRRCAFQPVYIRQTASDITGEFTSIMLSPLVTPDVPSTSWLKPFVDDFKQRFMQLLAGSFRGFTPALALSVLDPQLQFTEGAGGKEGGRKVVVMRANGQPLSPYDLKRLQAYSNNLIDHHMIFDLLPLLAQAYLSGAIPVTLSYGQAAIMVALGLQHTTVDDVSKALNLPANQVLALFNKMIRRLHGQLHAAQEAAVARTLPAPMAAPNMVAHEADLDEELEQGAQEVKAQMAALLNPDELQRYAVKGSEADFASALKDTSKGGGVSVKAQGDKNGPQNGLSEEGPGKKKRAPQPMLYKKDAKKQKKKFKAKGGKGGM